MVGYNHLPEMSISSVPIVQPVIVLSSPRWMARQPFGRRPTQAHACNVCNNYTRILVRKVCYLNPPETRSKTGQTLGEHKPQNPQNNSQYLEGGEL